MKTPPDTTIFLRLMVENSLGKGERRYSKGLHYEDSFTVYMPRSKETLVYDVTIDVKLRPEKK